MTADPRPAPPEHADRDAQKLDLGTIIYKHMERAGATLMWELADAILAAGFARTPERASGTAEPVVISATLHSAREVMQALLAGGRLINRYYGDPSDDEQYLYLDEAGYLCEEDGASAKAHRTNHFCWRGDDPQWRLLLGRAASPPSVGDTPSPEKK